MVDSASIEVNRRQRRAQSDGLDVRKWLSMLMRFHHGAGAVWRGVHVPSIEAEDQRPLHRDLETLKQERASTTTRLQGLLRSQGIRLTSLSPFPEPLDALRRWDGAPIPRGLRQRLRRVYAHHEFLSQQIAAVEAERRAVLQSAQDASLEQGRQVMQRKGIGSHGAGVLVREFLGGRTLTNRREVGGVAGLTPTPYQSGASARAQGITQAGNRHGRWRTMEVAWRWVRDQPESALRCWFRERFGGGGKRLRRIGIVAVARTLLMALGRFLETGGLPEGAALQEA